MELTQEKQRELAQRIVDEFSDFVKKELQHQIEEMKDNDELSWDYYVNDADVDNIKQRVVDRIFLDAVDEYKTSRCATSP